MSWSTQVPRLAGIGAAWSLYRNPRRSRADLHGFRDARLRELIGFVYRHVAFYRNWFDAAGVRPEDIQRAEDLAALPLLSKSELRDAPLQSRLADGVDPAGLVLHNTSGSSGEPFAIYRTSGEENLLQLLRLRAARQYGFRLLDRRADLTAPIGGGPKDPVRHTAKALRLAPVESVDTTQAADKLLRQVARIKPDVLTGYPGVLSQAAQRLPDYPDLHFRPRFVVVGGEPLTPLMRKQIEHGFHAPVYDMYGTNEFNLLAWQCPRGQHLHICDDAVIVEILRGGEPVEEGEQGEVVVTGLFSRTMPFIRYRTGDLATKGPGSCPCGQPFSTLGAVVGRTADYFQVPDGRTIQPFSILDPVMVYDDAWIEQHQLAHVASDRILLRVKLRREPRPGERERLMAAAEEAVRPAQFELEFVERFESHPTGKFRSYLSLEDVR